MSGVGHRGRLTRHPVFGPGRHEAGPYVHLVLDRAYGVQVPCPGYPFRPD